MYNTHLKFHSRGDDHTRLLQSSWDRSAGQQSSGLFILSHSRTPSASLRSYATLPFGEIWSCTRPVTACMHEAIVVATVGATVGRDRYADRSRQSLRVPKLTTAALLAMSLTVYQRPTSIFRDVRKIDWRRYCGQKCCSMGKLLHSKSWNISCLNSWKSNPMYNTQPKLYSKLLGK